MLDDDLRIKIKTLNELMWDRRLEWTDVERWLTHFSPEPENGPSEHLHALFLLSHFSFFNSHLMRALIHSLFRDLIQYPILVRLRRRHGNKLDLSALMPGYERSLKRIRFLGIGNPSESGTHLLYYFRQENRLSKNLFIHPHDLFEGSPRSPKLMNGIHHLIFLDDFCGSGTQAARYSKKLLTRIRELDAGVRLSYYPLFATSIGLEHVRTHTQFTDVETVCELDNSFRALDDTSRYFRELMVGIDREFARKMCERYGAMLESDANLGFGGCQLLLGFAHNIPNNTLPIFWSDGQKGHAWAPPFPRYSKEVGW